MDPGATLQPKEEKGKPTAVSKGRTDVTECTSSLSDGETIRVWPKLCNLSYTQQSPYPGALMELECKALVKVDSGASSHRPHPR